METLPVEVVAVIVQHLTVEEVAACCATNNSWRDTFNKDLLWRPYCTEKVAQYLEIAECMVEPAFVSPESESSTLNSICKWRLSYMRESHLWRNWKRGNFKVVNIENLNFYCECNREFGHDSLCCVWCSFLNDDCMIVCFSDKIQLWDIVKEPVLTKTLPLQVNWSLDFCKSLGSNKVVIVQCGLVQVFNLGINAIDNTPELSFFLHDEEKSSGNAILETDGCEYERCFIVGQIIVVVFGHPYSKMDIWSLETGKKVREVDCPMRGCEFIFIECSEAEMTVAVGVTTTLFDPRCLSPIHFFIFSLRSLDFLPFKESVYSYHGIICVTINDFIGIFYDKRMRIYNYQTSQLFVDVLLQFESPCTYYYLRTYLCTHIDKILFMEREGVWKSFTTVDGSEGIAEMMQVRGSSLHVVKDKLLWIANDFQNKDICKELKELLVLRTDCTAFTNISCTKQYLAVKDGVMQMIQFW